MNIQNITNCTGCGACMNICLQKAISMKVNSEGFLYPSIDGSKCTNCGLCLTKCPTHATKFTNTNNPRCYVAYADDDLRKNSSSGGIFPLLANYFFNNNGYVCGASWNDDNLVEHIIISDSKDLSKLQSSKYLQSNTKNVYTEIKQLLKDNKLVLFTGTPCQIAGLNSYLGKNYDNLLTVEIVCHGTPSPKVYKKYLQELVKDKNEKVLNTNFRDKINGWYPYSITTTTTLSKYTIPASKDIYMNAFLKDLSLRKSCGECPFAKLPRQADLTIGDFWGIQRYNKKYDDKKGTSLILVNNQNGEDYLNKIKNQFKLIEKAPLEYALRGNPVLTKPSIMHSERDNFFSRLDSMPLQENLDISLGKKYDCGILNLWCSSNYGALLTCYALQQSINKLGYNSKVINYILKPFKNTYQNSLSQYFAQKYLSLTPLCNDLNGLKELNNQTNTFIVGSDQVWRHSFFKSYNHNIVYHLNFANSDKKKIAYAASYGTDAYEGNIKDKTLIQFYKQRFDDISVREADGVDICRNTFGVKATHVLDPVFLLEPKEWDKLINNSNCNEKDFVVSYVLDKSPHAEKLINALKEKFGENNCINMVDAQSNRKNTTATKESVEDWLYNIKNCKFFITDSFHGACFAIIFNKPFICLANISRGYSRFKSLFDIFGLQNRCILNADDIENRNDLFDDINYLEINKILEKEKIRSIEWLKTALSTPKKEANPMEEIIDLLLSEIDELKYKIQTQAQTPQKQTFSKFNYYRYRILSKVLWGKKRKKYKQKYKELKKIKKSLKRK